MEANMESESAMSQSEVVMDFSDHAVESWDEADTYEVSEISGENDEGNVEQGQNESEDNAESNVSEDESEGFESISDSLGEEGNEDQSEDSSEASEDSSEAEGSEASGDVEEESAKSLEELIESGEFTVKAKVDGEEVDVSLAELKSNYAGKVAYDKKFTELGNERKSFESEVEEVNGYINEFAAKFKEGDGMGAMKFFAEFGGVPPHEFEKQLMQQLMPKFQEYLNKSPEQIDLEYRQQEADYYRRQSESLQQKSQYEQAQAELKLKSEELREAQMIDSETWTDAEAHLKAHLDDPSQATPELVRDFIIAERAENLIESVDAKLIENVTLLETVESVIRNNPDFTDDDIKSLLSQGQEEYVEKPKQEKVKKQVAKKVMESKPKQEVKNAQFEPEKDSEGNEIEDWEDLFY